MYFQQIDTIVKVHLILGWSAMTLGILSGSLMGMFFHREDWLGGYDSVPRRLIRLGHIAFFGMAFLNFSFAQTVYLLYVTNFLTAAGSIGLLIATITMPLVCFFSAARGISRAAFTIPVLGASMSVITIFFLLFALDFSFL